MIPRRNEERYQLIKLVLSGRTLTESKAMIKAVTVGLHKDFTKLSDMKDLQDLEGGLYRIRQTRGQAQQLMKIKFAPRKYSARKDETIAKFATGYRGKIPLNWKRDGNLIRKGKENKPRKDRRAKRIVKQTRVIGAKRVLKDFRQLIKTLQDLQRRFGKEDTRALRAAYKRVRTAATARKY